MTIALGRTPIIIRQRCSAAFTGVAPTGDTTSSDVTQIPYITNTITYPVGGVGTYGGGVEYVSPEELSLNSLNLGGLFVFPEAAYILEVRAFCGALATVTITITEPDDSNSIAIETAQPAVAERYSYLKLPLLRNQKLKIATSAAGVVDIYAVKADA